MAIVADEAPDDTGAVIGIVVSFGLSTPDSPRAVPVLQAASNSAQALVQSLHLGYISRHV